MPRRRNTLPKAVLDRVLELEGEQTTIREVLDVNYYHPDGVEPMTYKEVRELIDLEPGEQTIIGVIEIKRIS